MEAIKKTRGRKPIQDKKQVINLFIRQSRIDELGGKEKVKELIYSILNKTS